MKKEDLQGYVRRHLAEALNLYKGQHFTPEVADRIKAKAIEVANGVVPGFFDVDVEQDPKDHSRLNVRFSFDASVVAFKEPQIGTRWRHFKGNYYIVVAVAQDSDYPSRRLVVYREEKRGKVWARPLFEWDEQVIKPEYIGPRFVPED